jgi:hypothetical protein
MEVFSLEPDLKLKPAPPAAGEPAMHLTMAGPTKDNANGEAESIREGSVMSS